MMMIDSASIRHGEYGPHQSPLNMHLHTAHAARQSCRCSVMFYMLA